MYLFTNYTARMAVTNSGNVGIGTQTPGALLDVEASSSGPAINAVNSGSGDGIYASGGFYGGYFSGGSYSLNATDSGYAAGAYGIESGPTEENIGVFGTVASPSGAGVYGQNVGASATGESYGGYAGVWGDGGSSAYGLVAVLGTADDAWALSGINDSDFFPTITLLNNGGGGTGLVLQAVGKNGQCNSDVNGNLNCSGGVSAVAAVNGGANQVALSAIHAPENWFEDFGSSQLANGVAVVNIESVFGETINTGVEYHVFLTPNGDCKGLYVAEKSPTSFVVKELGGGTSSIAFDYRIAARRKGFENVRLPERTKAFSTANLLKRRARSAPKHIPSGLEIQKQMQEHLKQRTVATTALNRK